MIEKHIVALTDKYGPAAARVLRFAAALVITVLLVGSVKAQPLQEVNNAGSLFKVVGGKNGMIFPKDTSVRSRDSAYPHLAILEGVIYLFDSTVQKYWIPYSPGSTNAQTLDEVLTEGNITTKAARFGGIDFQPNGYFRLPAWGLEDPTGVSQGTMFIDTGQNAARIKLGSSFYNILTMINLSTDTALGPSNVLLPTQRAVRDYIANRGFLTADSINVQDTLFAIGEGLALVAGLGGAVDTLITASFDGTNIGAMTESMWALKQDAISFGYGNIFSGGIARIDTFSIATRANTIHLIDSALTGYVVGSFDNLSDVDPTGKDDGHVPYWDEADGKWKTREGTEIDLTGAVSGDIPMWNGTKFLKHTPSWLTTSAAAAAYQPLDTDLSTIAGLTATTDNFLVSVSSAWSSRTPAQVRTTLALVIGTDVQAFDADLSALAGVSGTNTIYYRSASNTWTAVAIGTGLDFTSGTLSATGGGGGASDLDDLTDVAISSPADGDVLTYNGTSWVNQAGTEITETGAAAGYLVGYTSAGQYEVRTPSQVRTTLGLVIGTDVQSYDADLTTLAGLTATTDNFIVSVSSAWASRTPAQVRTTLGLVIGTNVQAFDADLSTYAGITPSANVQSLLGAADYSAMRTLLGLVIGTNVQAFDADLSALAALSGTSTIYYRSAANTWTAVTVGSPITFSGGTLTVQNAAADGSTKGAAAFDVNDFNASSGVITLDYATARTWTAAHTWTVGGGSTTIGDIGSSIPGISFATTITGSNYAFAGGSGYTIVNAPSGFVARRIAAANVALDYASYSANLNPTYFGANTTPAAWVHTAAGTVSVANAIFTEGVALTTPIDGALEHFGNNWYVTVGSTRHQITDAGLRNAANTWSATNTFSGSVLFTGLTDVTPNFIAGLKSDGVMTQVSAGKGMKLTEDIEAKSYSLGTVTQNYGNTGTGEDNLEVYSVAAGLLAATNDEIIADYYFTTASNANSKTLKLYFGSDQLFTAPSLGPGVTYSANVRVIRTGASTQEIVVRWMDGNTGIVAILVTTASRTLSGANDLKWTAEAVADNDIVQTTSSKQFNSNN